MIVATQVFGAMIAVCRIKTAGDSVWEQGFIQVINQQTLVFVVQRQTLEWSTMTIGNISLCIGRFLPFVGKPSDYVFRPMQLWNETFALDYFQTRRIKNIALLNIAESDAIYSL